MIWVLEKETKSQKTYRSADGRWELKGEDLNCTGAAARAAGAGPCWMWRPVQGKFSRGFANKARCLLDLQQSLRSWEE